MQTRVSFLKRSLIGRKQNMTFDPCDRPAVLRSQESNKRMAARWMEGGEGRERRRSKKESEQEEGSGQFVNSRTDLMVSVFWFLCFVYMVPLLVSGYKGALALVRSLSLTLMSFSQSVS